jgi:predicted RNA-binding protein YlxR (DUF448 family)
MKRGHVPIRRCVGCGQRRPAHEMLHFKVVDETVVLVGRNENAPGRGCYACPENKCLEKALVKRRLERALRRNVAVVPSKEGLLRGLEKKG